MEKILYKIYELTFPCGNNYVGSTSQRFNKRYTVHRCYYQHKDKKPPINQLAEQYLFKEISCVELDRIECIKGDEKIRILEEKWKKKIHPTLNTYVAHVTNAEDKERMSQYGKRHYKNNKKQ